MKKRIFAVVLSVVLGSILGCPFISARANENRFKNYALPEATVDIASKLMGVSEDELANVVGVVKDYNTNEMISGAINFCKWRRYSRYRGRWTFSN